MDKSKKLLTYYIDKFPQTLGRTQLIKAIYLFDCQWYSIYGKTYTGYNYNRDNNGPFTTQFYESLNQLTTSSIIKEMPYIYSGGSGYEYYPGDKFEEIELSGIEKNIADNIIETLKYKTTKEFLSIAYNTEPMKVILYREETERKGQKMRGEEIPMDHLRKNLKPLFSLKQIKERARTFEMYNTGSDEEYNKTILEENKALYDVRERVDKVWEKTGER